MELLIFSDSHGNIEGMRRAFARQIKRPNAVCFLGDGILDAERLMELEPLCSALWYCVRGNCDWGSLGDGYPTDRVLDLEGHRLFLTHGHYHYVKDTCSQLLSKAVEIGADIVLFGHTHVPLNVTVPEGESFAGVTVPRTTYLFNPGSIGMREGSFGTLLLTGSEVLFSHGSIY